MMNRKLKLRGAVLLALATPLVASADWTFDGFLKNETGFNSTGGQYIGEAKRLKGDTTSGHSGGDVFKTEVTGRMFINGDIFEDSSLHVELNLQNDFDATPQRFRGLKEYTQQDPLRELYVDTSIGDTDIRIGKQQVVWGTADGIKLLDIINPTDFREFVQNTTEDARIPLWMVNVDTPIGENGSFQFILSEVEENKIPGLQAGGDSGAPYILKGVDSITGPVNGFVNIGPAMGQVARFFAQAAGGGFNLTGFTGATVQEFVDDNPDAAGFGGACQAEGIGAGATTNANCLNQLANETNNLGGNIVNPLKGGNDDITNLLDATTTIQFDGDNPNSIFEYMNNTTFATFHSFSGMTTEYRTVRPKSDSPNVGFRFKNSTDGGTNYSLNYFYHYDSNPYVDLSWEDQNGNPLNVSYSNLAAGAGGNGNGAATTTVSLQSGGTAILAQNLGGTQTANLVFTERLNRIHSFGASFDTAFDTSFAPVVVRGEFLYDQGVKTAVIDRAAFNIGDIEKALRSENADFFKYVIGVDVTVLTNMLVSGQFIQFINLDYIDETGRAPTRNGVTSTVTGDRYTAESSVLALSNGLQKAREYKEFYSLFFSKPFGEAQLGRFNNITLLEEGGGYWNRLDVEYSFTDEWVGTAEWNQYGGDTNTTFGQLKNSSNVQFGVKYIF